jgi:hypothetical protein
MYWIYDIPAELLGLLFAFTFASFAVAGVFITRKIRGPRVHEEGWQEHVVIVLEGAFAFFGLLLALVAIAAYDNYTDARSKTAAEASEVGSLYRIVSAYPEPIRGQLQADLRDYIRYVIEKAWPLHCAQTHLSGTFRVEPSAFQIPSTPVQRLTVNLVRVPETLNWSQCGTEGD